MHLISLLVIAAGALCVTASPVNQRKVGAALRQIEATSSERRKRSTNKCSSKNNTLDEEAQDDVLFYHNEERAEINATAMYLLGWSGEIADYAQHWAEGCVFEHGNTEPCVNGQNLYLTDNVSETWEAAVKSWNEEKKFYNYTSNTCQNGKVCGHYTQVVWANTRHVGCAKHICPNITTNKEGERVGPFAYFVCHYSIGGNVIGAKPYVEGTPCTECETQNGIYCEDGKLCEPCVPEEFGEDCVCKRVCQNGGTRNANTCTCACAEGSKGANCETVCTRVCQNGGTLNANTCTCACAEGVEGANCEITCDNKDDGCAEWKNQGYCAEGDHGFYGYMKGNCRKACGFCS